MAEVLAPEDLVDAEGAPTTDTLARGTRLGRYELLLPVAMGGMAKVWAARQHGQRGFSKLVAIKTILPHLSQDPAFERMFLDEARIAAGVHHPNVAEIYDLGEEGSVLYIAMEWVTGDSLVRVLRAFGPTEPLDPRIAVRIVADACAGLHAAHELTDDEGRPLGVVHRDVSPHNILLSADGHVKVTDFGVAKAFGQLHDATSSGTLKGKLNYMAPEQVNSGLIDRRTDVFALGCVLYEATTGRVPFRERGETEAQVMHRLLHGSCPSPSSLVRGYPPELEGLVMRALSTSPMKRFGTAERLRVALEEWLVHSGPIVTHAQVAAAVRARIGHAMEQRRERIRAATAASADETPASKASPSLAPPAPTATQSASGVVPSGAAPRGSVPDAGVSASSPIAPGLPAMPLSAPPPPPEASTGQYVLAAAGGIGVALLLALGGLLLWRATRAPEGAAPAAATTAISTPAEPTNVAPAASAVPAASSEPAVAPTPPSTGAATEPDESATAASSAPAAEPRPSAEPGRHHRHDPIPANPY